MGGGGGEGGRDMLVKSMSQSTNCIGRVATNWKFVKGKKKIVPGQVTQYRPPSFHKRMLHREIMYFRQFPDIFQELSGRLLYG